MTEAQMQQLHGLLDEGRKIKYEHYPVTSTIFENPIDSEKSKEYEIWEKKVKAFAVSNLAGHPLYSDLIKSIDGSSSLLTSSEAVCNILQAILETL